MTKKDYKLIATALKPFYRDDLTLAEFQIFQALIGAFYKDNPRFDKIRFLDELRGYTKQ